MALTTISGETQAQPLNDNFSFLNEKINNYGIYNVKDEEYGATGDGVTYDTLSIQTAIDVAEAAGGGIVLFPPGTYLISATLTVEGSDIMLNGHGGSSIIKCDFASGNIIYAGSSSASGVDRIWFKNFAISSSVAKTSGAAIHCEHADKFVISNLKIDTNIYDAIYLQYFDNTLIERCLISHSHHGITAHGKSDQTWGANLWINGGNRILATSFTSTIGVKLGGSCGGVSIEDSDIINNRYGIWLSDDLSTAKNREVFLNQCYIDGSGNFGIQVAASGVVLLHLNNTWVSASGSDTPAGGYASGNNINTSSTQDPDFKVLMDGCRIYNAYGSGVVINNGAWIINDCFIHNNGKGTDGGNGVMVLNSNASDLVFSSNNITTNGNTANGTGIYVTANTDNYIITNNLIRNNGLAEITDNGASNKVVANNLTT